MVRGRYFFLHQKESKKWRVSLPASVLFSVPPTYCSSKLEAESSFFLRAFPLHKKNKCWQNFRRFLLHRGHRKTTMQLCILLQNQTFEPSNPNEPVCYIHRNSVGKYVKSLGTQARSCPGCCFHTIEEN